MESSKENLDDFGLNEAQSKLASEVDVDELEN